MHNSVNTIAMESCRTAKYYSLHIEVNIVRIKDAERTKQTMNSNNLVNSNYWLLSLWTVVSTTCSIQINMNTKIMESHSF
jgi:hypothetical protein